jgi:adenine C2-methylase RlmN of 23S rRNA A2503 and tRNA A37
LSTDDTTVSESNESLLAQLLYVECVIKVPLTVVSQPTIGTQGRKGKSSTSAVSLARPKHTRSKGGTTSVNADRSADVDGACGELVVSSRDDTTS